MSERFEGLLGNPMFNIGLGLLGAGLSRPETLGQGLLGGMQAGSQMQHAALRNQMHRDQMEQMAHQRDAQARLGAGVSSGEITDEQELMGLLAQAAPEQFAQGLLGQVFPQERAEPSFVRMVRALEDPSLDDEQRELLRNHLVADPSSTDEMLRALDVQLRGMRLQQEQRQLDREDRDEREARGDLIVSVRGDLNAARELAELNDRLAGTALETGMPASELRRLVASGGAAVGRALGIDTSEAQQLVADFDRFEKLSTDFGLKSAQRMFDRGQITNLQLQAVRDASVSPFVAPDANRRVIADMVDLLLTSADRADIEIADRERFERLLGREEPRERREEPRQRREETRELLEETREMLDLGDGATLEFID